MPIARPLAVLAGCLLLAAGCRSVNNEEEKAKAHDGGQQVQGHQPQPLPQGGVVTTPKKPEPAPGNDEEEYRKGYNAGLEARGRQPNFDPKKAEANPPAPPPPAGQSAEWRRGYFAGVEAADRGSTRQK